jgi:hypothetical protein
LDDSTDRKIARLGTRSHGVVKRRDLLRAGVTVGEIKRRLRSGALILEYPGVYRVGHRAPSTHASYLSAVYACGDEAVLSDRAAAHIWGLTKGAAPPPEVTAPGRRAVTGVKTKRSRQIDATLRDGIPITTVARTIVDLAAGLEPDELARVCHEAGVRYRTTPAEVKAVLKRRPNSPGAKRLKAVLYGEVKVTLSELEKRFLVLLRRDGLPLPETNRAAGGRRVDCRWPDHKLTVELDSYTYHRSRHAWENDRGREREAYARGDQFRRFTRGDVFERPEPMLVELRGLLRG